MQLAEDAINLVLTVLDLLVLYQRELLELEQSLEDHTHILLHDGCQPRLVIHHERDDLDEAAERLAG